MRIGSPSEFRAKWQQRNQMYLIMGVLFSIAIAWSAYHFTNIPGWYAGALAVATISFLMHHTSTKNPTTLDAEREMHAQHPTLEFSTHLVEQPPSDLSPLEKIQHEKIKERLRGLTFRIPGGQQFLQPGLMGLAMLTAILFISKPLFDYSTSTTEDLPGDLRGITEIPSESIDTVSIIDVYSTITPPRYTGIKKSTSTNHQLKVPEGSTINFEVSVVGNFDKILMVSNTGDTVTATSEARFSRTLMSSGYQYFTVVGPNNTFTSKYYSIKTIEDENPKITVHNLEEYQRLPFRPNYDLSFDVEIKDDYGIEDAFMLATVATGQGEAVQFREKQFRLPAFKSMAKNYKNTYSLSTRDFNLEPGSELYFYIAAKDNCTFDIQSTKSPTYFIIIEDTAKYALVDDGGMQVDLMPDFFRSQRQLIIDTEKLIAEKSQISREEFNQRSNELGFDQKLLRLKYGQFLGEESESGIAIENEIENEEDHEGHDHDHDHDHDHGPDGHQSIGAWSQSVLEHFGHNHDHEDEPNQLLESRGTEQEDPSRPDWVKALSHDHDNVEQATYFDMPVKSKLKAALAEMWDSELYLRLFEPKKSLPYQYKSLKLLQEIKNHARAYVHRIGFDPPPIKEAEKRLSGDLDEIARPQKQTTFKSQEEFPSIRKILPLLFEKITQNASTLSEDEKEMLRKAANEVASVAVEDVSQITTLSNIQSILKSENPISTKQLESIYKSLRKIITHLPDATDDTPYLSHPLIDAVLKEAVD